MPNGAYPLHLDPVARPGDVLRLHPLTTADGDPVFREVESFFIQPSVQVFQSAVTVPANDQATDEEATELSMPESMLGQFRMLKPGVDIPDDISIRVDQGGRQSPLYTTKNARGRYDETIGAIEAQDNAAAAFTSDLVETRLTELYVWQAETTPFFTFTNASGAPIDLEDLRFSGYAYVLGDQLESAPRNRTPVAVPVARIRPV